MKSHAAFWARLFLFAAACFAHAQTGFQSLGTWSTPQPATCASGFYGKNCFSTIVSCPGTTSLTATYGYALGTVVPPPGEIPLDCTDNSPDAQFCLNNSTSQGQIFFSNFTSSSQFLHLSLNAIQNCQGSEG